MKRWLAGMWLAAALPLIAGTPNFTGRWKLNETLTQGANHHGTVYLIEHNEPRFKYSASGNAGYAGRIEESYEFTTDGKYQPEAGKVKMAGQWDGPVLVMRLMKGPNELIRMRFRLTDDGRQMIREMNLTNGRQIKEIYDRQ
jgi:hypothetical protein